MSFLTLIDRVREDGGATVNGGRIVQHGEGFQVSTGREMTAQDLNELALMIDIMQLKDYGLWFDASGGIWFLDTRSEHIMDQQEAEALGRKHKQRAIWDWKRGEAITL